MTIDETRVMATVRRAISDVENALQQPRDLTAAIRHLDEVIAICESCADILAKDA